MISVARPLVRLRRKCQGEAGEFPLIDGPYFLPTLPIHLNPAELMDPNSRLNVHHVVLVATIDNVVVLVTLITESPPRVFAHAVQGKDFESISMLLVHRQDHSALAGRHVLITDLNR